MGRGPPGSPMGWDQHDIPTPQQSLQAGLMHWHGPSLHKPASERKPTMVQLYLTPRAVGNGKKTNGLYFTTSRMLHPLVIRN